MKEPVERRHYIAMTFMSTITVTSDVAELSYAHVSL